MFNASFLANSFCSTFTRYISILQSDTNGTFQLKHLLPSGILQKGPWSRLHLHPFEGVALSSATVGQDVPCPPVNAVRHAAVAPVVIPAVQVGRQAGVKPPACAVVLATVAAGVAVVVSVCGAEGSAVVVVALAVAQRVARVAGVFPRCQPVPTTLSILVRWALKLTEDAPRNISTKFPYVHVLFCFF